MMRIFLTLALAITMGISLLNAQSDKEPTDQELTTITKIGQTAPDFSVTTIDGKEIKISDLKGKTVVVCFFATWCPPCMKELPVLEKELWTPNKNKDLVVLALGRGHSMEEMKAFQKKKGFTFHIAPDKDKKAYELYASKYIPRAVIINKEGKIIEQTNGFTMEEFNHVKKLVEKNL